MITVEQIIGIALASVVLIVVPGPSVMFVIGRALSYGRSIAIASIVGNTLGCYAVGAAIALGLGPLLEGSEILFQTVKWAGVVYLLYLGVQAIRYAAPVSESPQGGVDDSNEHGKAAASRGAIAPGEGATVETPRARPSVSVWGAVRTGFIVGVTNPKVLVIFTVIVPQFMNPALGAAAAQMLVLGLVPVVIGLITDGCWAVAAAKARGWFASSPKRMTWMGRVGGASIIGVGLSVAVSHD